MICKILLYFATCAELWTVDTADFDWNVIDRDLFKQIVTKQSFSGYITFYEKKLCANVISHWNDKLSQSRIQFASISTSREKNKTDSTVFHFLVKSNLLGKLEISEEIESFWEY